MGADAGAGSGFFLETLPSIFRSSARTFLTCGGDLDREESGPLEFHRRFAGTALRGGDRETDRSEYLGRFLGGGVREPDVEL